MKKEDMGTLPVSYPLNDKSLTVLDCTFRDGGYYTNWHFDPELVVRYIALCGKIGIDVIELGYISLSENKAGPFGNLPDGIPSDLGGLVHDYPQLRFAAMIDVKDLSSMCQTEIAPSIRAHLLSASLPITVLRFAVHFSHVSHLGCYIHELQASGYDICINLMQIDLASPSELQTCIDDLQKYSDLSSVYLADSLGSLSPDKVRSLISRFSDALTCPIGYHAHDNIGLALHNSLVAIEAGATWIDSTVYGMGRGAGNAKTEQVISILRKDVTFEKQFELYSFISQYFQDMHKVYGWGATPLYGVSGSGRIHPSYVQALEDNDTYSVVEKMDVLVLLKEMDAAKFSSAQLDEAFSTIASTSVIANDAKQTREVVHDYA